jgi:hypothetical protein
MPISFTTLPQRSSSWAMYVPISCGVEGEGSTPASNKAFLVSAEAISLPISD